MISCNSNKEQVLQHYFLNPMVRFFVVVIGDSGRMGKSLVIRGAETQNLVLETDTLPYLNRILNSTVFGAEVGKQEEFIKWTP